MDLAREKAVLFLTDFDDSLPKEFSVECPNYELAFFPNMNLRKHTDWCVAWVCDDRGDVQAWLDHLPSGQSHFLGPDAQQAMRSAARLISAWDAAKIEQEDASKWQ